MCDALFASVCLNDSTVCQFECRDKARDQSHLLGGEPDDVIPSVHQSLALSEFHCVSSSLLPFLPPTTHRVCIVCIVQTL